MSDDPTAKEVLSDFTKVLNNTRLTNEATIEWLGLRAKQVRAFYEALVSEGFSEIQALDLIKARGVSM